MTRIMLRPALAASAVLLGLAVAAAPASASEVTPAAEKATVSQPATVNAVWRAAYWNYYDCDVAGFTGVYYGWWQGYFCNYRPGSSPAIWDLYA
ncbi:hypothetical protein [Amycolatopsis sp. NPDC051128]